MSCLALSVVASPAAAAPDLLAGVHLGDDGTYATPGVTLASADGFVLGLDVGLVHFEEDSWGLLDALGWWGAYADGVYDFGSSTGRASLGVGVGALVFGVDLGVAAEFSDDDSAFGVTGRVLASFAIAHFYARLSYFPERAREDDFVPEVGVLLKIPLLVDRDE